MRFETRRPAPWRQWGSDPDPASVEQIERACSLPVAVRGALMPDAHLGYGLPIGGVLATDGAVIPYAVGVDIACRMKLSLWDMPPAALDERGDRLARAIEAETRFGIGASFSRRREHAVMDEDWDVTVVTGRLKDKAWSQLGTSGSGNHFVELGVLTLEAPELGLEPGRYLALLSHSGSRGVGNAVARHFSELAASLRPELPRELRHLAWLDLDSDAGHDYWQAMQLMGRYAAANHDLIHRHLAGHLGVRVVSGVENHHNFAWLEDHDGRRVVVHRKGATPAGEGVLGIIPGSMATPAYVVRGLGNEASLQSAAHGAGRRMSRKQAKKRFSWRDVKELLDERRVRVLSAGLDEVPMAYKDIDEVMAAQHDLVRPVASFQPRLVKMAPGGEPPED
ncbi:MAG TPA: RtcB family protein [Candidatus Sulfomarinibacteraceae bacterium]|nr:RtcB family protein [Candidatus Sulfomarinibacteraceae bacterium]